MPSPRRITIVELSQNGVECFETTSFSWKCSSDPLSGIGKPPRLRLAVSVGRSIAFRTLQGVGRCPTILHLSGFPLVIPSARGRDNLPPQRPSLVQFILTHFRTLVKNLFVPNETLVFLEFNVLKCDD